MYLSPLHPGAAALDQRLDFLERRHRCVAGRGHGQCAVGRAVLHSLLRIVELEQAINQPAGEAIASTDAIQNLQVLAVRRFVELAARPANRAPVIARGRSNRAQGRGYDLEVRVRLNGFADHLLKGRYLNPGEVFVRALDCKTEARSEEHTSELQSLRHL